MRLAYVVVFMFIGLCVGLILAVFDRLADIHHRKFLLLWSVATLLFMAAGGVIGYLLRKMLTAFRKKEEALVELNNMVHELSRLQSEMAKLERLNLIGHFAAGLAHEVRNPLTTVRGYLQFLSKNKSLQPHFSKFDLMIQELDRTNAIITDFLSFVKKPGEGMKAQNLNDILQHIHPLLEADAFSQNKNFKLNLLTTPNVTINANEVIQMVLNLCRNGLEAMQNHGTLVVRTYQDVNHVVLAVQDEGCGISEELMEKLGTPFFTTKESGTGLGLMTCYRIAARHHAKIGVESGSDGTRFYVHFPIYDSPW